MNRGRLLSVSVLFVALVAMAGVGSAVTMENHTITDATDGDNVVIEGDTINVTADSTGVYVDFTWNNQTRSLNNSYGDFWTLEFTLNSTSLNDEATFVSNDGSGSAKSKDTDTVAVNLSYKDTTAPTLSNIAFTDATDGDGNVTEGDTINVSLDVDETPSTLYMDWNGHRRNLTYSSGTATASFALNSTSIGTASFYVEDSAGNNNTLDHPPALTYVTESTDNTTSTNYTVLRDAPTDQSFTYLQNDDSVNVTVDNDTVIVANGSTSGVYVTNEIKSDHFVNATITTFAVNDSVSLDVLNASAENETVIKTYSISDETVINFEFGDTYANVTHLRFRFNIDSGDDEITGFQVYGELYSGGSGGGTVAPITGGITKAFNGIGNIFGGIGTLLTESVSGGIDQIVGGITDTVLGTLDAVIGVPVAVFDFVTGLIPS